MCLTDKRRLILYSQHTTWLTLTLHHELSHRLAAICFNLVVAAVFLRGFVNDQNVFAAVFLEPVLKRLVSCQFHAIFLPAQKFTRHPEWLWWRVTAQSVTIKLVGRSSSAGYKHHMVKWIQAQRSSYYFWSFQPHLTLLWSPPLIQHDHLFSHDWRFTFRSCDDNSASSIDWMMTVRCCWKLWKLSLDI